MSMEYKMDLNESIIMEYCDRKVSPRVTFISLILLKVIPLKFNDLSVIPSGNNSEYKKRFKR